MYFIHFYSFIIFNLILINGEQREKDEDLFGWGSFMWKDIAS